MDWAGTEVESCDLFSWSADDEKDTFIDILGRLSSAEEDFTLIIGRFGAEDAFEDEILCFPSIFFVFFASDEVLSKK